MKKNIYFIRSVLLLCILLSAFNIHSQKKEFELPGLDNNKNTYTLEFSNDPEKKNIISAYMEGETEQDSLRFIGKISTVVERVMVTVITENPNQEIQVDIVKNHWSDVKRSGKTKNGSFQISFDTANKFGIVLTSKEANIPFHMAVWTSGKIIPKSSLFYSVDSQNNGTSNTTSITNGSSQDIQEIQNQRSNVLLYAVIGLLVIIVILLVVIYLRKKSNKINLFLIIFLSSHLMVYSNARRSNSAGFKAAVAQAFKQSNEYLDLIYKIDDFASSLNAIQQGIESFNNFLDDLENRESVDLDPAGQPRLPSSCLASNANGGQNDPSGGQGNNNEGPENGNNSNSDSETNDDVENEKPNNTNNSNTDNFDTYKPDLGPGEAGNNFTETVRLPRYDRDGNRIDSGSFPKSPTKISPERTSPLENPFIEGDVQSGTALRLPKYDETGQLKNPGDYPDAPKIIDPELGIPPMNPFIEGSTSNKTYVRHPKYSESGDLLDPGDFPNAPSHIDPKNPVTLNDPPGEDNQNQDDSQDQDNQNRDDSQDQDNRNGYSPPGGIDPQDPNDRRRKDTNKRKKKGCECLEKAYKKLEDTRYRLETLRILTARTDRMTDHWISFGDDASAVHGVVGIVWQEKRVEILKAMKRFDRTRETKYQEMIQELYKNLIEIDKCEALLGFENWYSNAGFIYYSFMKDKYSR